MTSRPDQGIVATMGSPLSTRQEGAWMRSHESQVCTKTASGYVCPRCGSWATWMDMEDVPEEMVRGRLRLMDFKRPDRGGSLCD